MKIDCPGMLGHEEFGYDVMGNFLSHTSAHYQDTNMGGLLQLGVRFLDPSVGRFTQVDPVRDGLNWYGYVASRPVLLIDTSGLWGTIDFVRHYGDGHGTTVDLGDVGLLDEYKSHVADTTNAYKTDTIAEGMRKAVTLCNAQGNTGSVSVPWSGTSRENMDAPKLLGLYRNPMNPLFSIGAHSLWEHGYCRGQADCCKRRLTWSCEFSFGFADMFKDPLDFEHLGGKPVEIGFPYWITASWSEHSCNVYQF